MADHDPSEGPTKRHIGGELVIPVAALLFTLYYFSTIIDVPWTAQVSAVFVGTILIILIIAFLARSFMAIRRGEADLDMENLIAPVSYLPKRLILGGLTIAYIFLIHWGGFTLTSFAFLSLAMMTLSEGRRKALIISLSLILSFGGWLLFVVAFETRFPEGPFELMMKGLF